MKKISFVVNGLERSLGVRPDLRLLDVLREHLNLTGAKEGCGEGECGACTVLLDGKPVNSCLVLVGQVEGRHVTTIEGLSRENEMHPLQRAFINEGAIQCGYCTPGMILAAKSILDANPNPSEEEIRRGISGNLCRCTGYQKILRAVKAAAGETNSGAAG